MELMRAGGCYPRRDKPGGSRNRLTSRCIACPTTTLTAPSTSATGGSLSPSRLNLLLTVVEAVAGLLAGSLALLADALHNFNDCGSLVIALIARRIGRLPSDDRRTFGYRRAEIIGALINLTILVVIGLYLVYEAIARFFQPQEIDGWIVVGVAAVALVIDVATAALLFAMSRGNLNLRAAYLHNLGDAASSVGVIIAGAAILWFGVIGSTLWSRSSSPASFSGKA